MQEITDILKIPKSIKLLVKMKNMYFILWKNHTDFLASPILGRFTSKQLSVV